MLKTIAAAFLLASSARAVPGPLINGNQINPQSGISISSLNVTGTGGESVAGAVTASSFTATGNGFKGAGTGLTGTAASLTAGNVTTNANLTGGVTSVGNAATVVTNANLTGDVTSVGNATTAAATQANIKVLSGLTTISNPWTSTSSGTVKGTTDGTAAPAGYVGEIITANGTGTQLPPTNTDVSVATITLTAGAWEIIGEWAMSLGATTAMTGFRAGLSATANASPGTSGPGLAIWAQNFTVNGDYWGNVGPVFVSVGSSTPYYLVMRVTYSVAGGATLNNANCHMEARRIR